MAVNQTGQNAGDPLNRQHDSGIGNFHMRAFLVRGILNARLYRKPASGIAHGFVFWGMLILFIGTILVFLNVLFGVPVFSGGFNRWYMSFVLDLAGLLSLAGIVFFLVRRMILPDRLRLPEARKGFVPVSSLLGMVLITGFSLRARE